MSRATVRITEQDFKKFINNIPQELYWDKGKCYIVTPFKNTNKRHFPIEVEYKPEVGRVYFRAVIDAYGVSRRTKEPMETIQHLAKIKGIKVEEDASDERLYFTLMCRFKNQQINYLAKMEQLLIECEYFNYHYTFIQSHSDL